MDILNLKKRSPHASSKTNRVNSQSFREQKVRDNKCKICDVKHCFSQHSLLLKDTKNWLPMLPQVFNCQISRVLLLAGVGTIFTALTSAPGWAVTVAPTSITVTVPSNSKNTQAAGNYTYSGPGGTSRASAALTGTSTAASTEFIDDVLIQSMTFGGTTISNFRGSQAGGALVTTNPGTTTTRRDLISATYGNSDDGTDNNNNPFVKSGSGATAFNSTINQTPAVQDTAIAAAFGSLSLTEGVESLGQSNQAGATDYTFNLLFQNGIVDNDSAADSVPEIITFERGTGAQSSTYRVRAIIGGSLANPTLSTSSVDILTNNTASGNQTPSGISIRTVDKNTVAEPINLAGIDLNEFGVSAGQAIYGVQVSSLNGSGADIFGLTLTAADASQFRNQTVVPEPLTIFGSGMALGFGVLMQRQYSKKQKQA